MIDLLERAPKAIGLVSFAVLLLSVVHEYGYFSVIGSHFQTVATSIDYLTNALLWLPTIVAIFLSLQSLELGLNLKDGKIAFTSLFYWGWAASVVGILSYIFIAGTVEFSAAIFTGFGAVYFIAGRFPNNLDRGQWSSIKFLFAFVWTLFAIFGYGAKSGYDDLRKTSDVYSVVEKEPPNSRSLVMLRNFEKGILVRDNSAERTEFIQWENIRRVTKIAAPDHTVGYLCLWRGWLCGDYGPYVP